MAKETTQSAVPVAATELQIIQAKSAADFALTPIGQQIKLFEIQQRQAQMYSTSTIIPETYRGNLGNCVIALDMANRMGVNPLMCMQNLAIIKGNPSFSSKFLIATVNACGRFTPLRYEFKGQEGSPNWSCRCIAYEASDKEHKDPLYGDWISIAMAKSEGWYDKNGSKWQTMPGQMLRYRAAAFWQRVYAPEISMGFLTTEEAQDIDDQTQTAFEVKKEIQSNANQQTISIEGAGKSKDEEKVPTAEPPKKKVTEPLPPTDDMPSFMNGE